jgi:hypothetical protein
MKIEEAYTWSRQADGIVTVSFDDNRNGSQALMRIDTLINALEEFKEETHAVEVNLRVAPLKGTSNRVKDHENAILLTTRDATRLGRIVCPAVDKENE